MTIQLLKNTFVALLLLSQVVLAQGRGGIDAGGGGNGIIKGSKIYLVDLVEVGILDQDLTYLRSPLFESALKNLDWLDPIVLQTLASRLYTVSISDPLFAAALTKAILYYDWSFTPSDLKEINFENELLNEKIIQLAVRTPMRILISSKAWEKMPPLHQAALIFHEVSSALILGKTPLLRARQLTGALFSQNFALKLSPIYENEIQKSWPSQSTIIAQHPELVSPNTSFVFLRDPTLPDSPEEPRQWDVVLAPSVRISTTDDHLSTFSTFLDSSNVKSLTTGICESKTSSPYIRYLVYNYYRLDTELGPIEDINQPRLKVILRNSVWLAYSLPQNKNCSSFDQNILEQIYSRYKSSIYQQ